MVLTVGKLGRREALVSSKVADKLALDVCVMFSCVVVHMAAL